MLIQVTKLFSEAINFFLVFQSFSNPFYIRNISYIWNSKKCYCVNIDTFTLNQKLSSLLVEFKTKWGVKRSGNSCNWHCRKRKYGSAECIYFDLTPEADKVFADSGVLSPTCSGAVHTLFRVIYVHRLRVIGGVTLYLFPPLSLARTTSPPPLPP